MGDEAPGGSPVNSGSPSDESPRPIMPGAHRPAMPRGPRPFVPLHKSATIAAPSKAPPRVPNLPPPKAWQKSGSGGGSPVRPTVPSCPKPRGTLGATRATSASASGLPVRTNVPAPHILLNRTASTPSLSPDHDIGSREIRRGDSGIGFRPEDFLSDDEPPIFPTEEEKQKQLQQEQEQAKLAKKSDKQMLKEEVTAFVRKVKMAYLLDGIEVERHTPNQKPQQIVLKLNKDCQAVRWGVGSARGGEANLSETILVSDMKKLEWVPKLGSQKAGLSFSVSLGEDDVLYLVAKNTQDFEGAVESFRALMGMNLGAKSLKEIKTISDWEKYVGTLDEAYVPDLSPPQPPSAPTAYDFITPID